MSRDCCEVVASIDCEAPPGGPAQSRLVTCYRCGLPCCKPCSKIVVYVGHRTRFCGNCVDEALRHKERVTEVGGGPLTAVGAVAEVRSP